MRTVFKIVLAFAAVVLPVLAAQAVLSFKTLGKPLGPVLGSLVIMVVASHSYRAYVGWVEKRPLSEFAPRGALAELGGGFLIGALLFAGTIGALALLGVYRTTGTGAWSDAIAPLAAAMAAGLLEEILFRGVIFRITEESLGSGIALLISASLFGLIHLIDPHATLQDAVAIIFEAGILLAAAYMVTRRLWLPIGAHVGWNFTQGGIFGAAVSGNPVNGLLHGTLNGPAFLAGGEFGAEASIVSIVLCTLAGGALLALARRRGHFREPFWRAPANQGTS
jgi:membrane protease YdiL (CAAX protease family)